MILRTERELGHVMRNPGMRATSPSIIEHILYAHHAPQPLKSLLSTAVKPTYATHAKSSPSRHKQAPEVILLCPKFLLFRATVRHLITEFSAAVTIVFFRFVLR